MFGWSEKRIDPPQPLPSVRASEEALGEEFPETIEEVGASLVRRAQMLRSAAQAHVRKADEIRALADKEQAKADRLIREAFALETAAPILGAGDSGTQV